jgi:hydrogenase nickel incorporation protein HypA/HybF
MHELSLATSLLEIVRDELAKHGATKLIKVRVRFGPLANVVPEALELAWASLAVEAGFASAELEMLGDPLVLTCGECAKDFTPDPPVPYVDCPYCGSNFFHSIKSGKEFYLERLEAE